MSSLSSENRNGIWSLLRVLKELTKTIETDVFQFSLTLSPRLEGYSRKFVCDSAVGSNDFMLPLRGEHDYFLSPWSPVRMAAVSEEIILWLGFHLFFFFPFTKSVLSVSLLSRFFFNLFGYFWVSLLWDCTKACLTCLTQSKEKPFSHFYITATSRFKKSNYLKIFTITLSSKQLGHCGVNSLDVAMESTDLPS